MARYTGPSCKLCRREGKKLFLKGERCYTGKCAVSRRAYAPGQHGQDRKKVSEYGLQLREKQKVKRYYGVLESQFAKYFDMAAAKEGVTGTIFLQILESRFDNVAYRLGFGSSRNEARQFVRHGFFTINGRKVDIASYLVKPGDVIALAENKKKVDAFKTVMENNASRPIPAWLELDRENVVAKVVSLPARENIDFEIEEQLIVELYSK